MLLWAEEQGRGDTSQILLSAGDWWQHVKVLCQWYRLTKPGVQRVQGVGVQNHYPEALRKLQDLLAQGPQTQGPSGAMGGSWGESRKWWGLGTPGCTFELKFLSFLFFFLKFIGRPTRGRRGRIAKERLSAELQLFWK